MAEIIYTGDEYDVDFILGILANLPRYAAHRDLNAAEGLTSYIQQAVIVRDLSFAYEHPDDYKRTAEAVGLMDNRFALASSLRGRVDDALSELKVPRVIEARAKGVYSIDGKLKRFPFLTTDDIFDLVGCRVIVPEMDLDNIQETLVQKGGFVLMQDKTLGDGRLHVAKRIVHKDNGYNALHLNVILDGTLFGLRADFVGEIQITNQPTIMAMLESFRITGVNPLTDYK